MPRRIEIAPAARQELSHAIDGLLRTSRAKADQFADSYETAILNLRAFPLLGRPLGDKVHHLSITRSDFAIVYRVSGEEITIVAFAHASREPGYWRERL